MLSSRGTSSFSRKNSLSSSSSFSSSFSSSSYSKTIFNNVKIPVVGRNFSQFSNFHKIEKKKTFAISPASQRVASKLGTKKNDRSSAFSSTACLKKDSDLRNSSLIQQRAQDDLPSAKNTVSRRISEEEFRAIRMKPHEKPFWNVFDYISGALFLGLKIICFRNKKKKKKKIEFPKKKKKEFCSFASPTFWKEMRRIVATSKVPGP